MLQCLQFKEVNKIPLKTIKQLPKKARMMWERVFKEMQDKGYSEAKSAKIAWTAVKKRYEKQGDKWVLKKEKHSKSHQIDEMKLQKDKRGSTYLEGYLTKFAPDDEGHIVTKEFAEKIMYDLEFGGLLHDPEYAGVLVLEDKKVDDEGLWGRVRLDENHKKVEEVKEYINKHKTELGFSLEFGTPMIGGTELKKYEDGDYYLHITDGEGYGFGLTHIPRQPDSTAEVK